jgi:hypothetical protein
MKSYIIRHSGARWISLSRSAKHKINQVSPFRVRLHKCKKLEIYISEGKEAKNKKKMLSV